MAYTGKYIDRTPIICPAGVPIEIKDTVASCLKIYPMDDAIEGELHAGGLIPLPLEPRVQRMEAFRHRGIFNYSKDLLHPPLPTRYQTLLTDLQDTSLESYWNKEVGKGRDACGGLPKGMHPKTTLFGKATPRDSLRDIVNPPKSTFQVLYETDEYHDMYKRSHNDYYPSEHVDRNYDKPPYSPEKVYGMKTNYDPRGIFAKCCLTQPNSEPTAFVTNTQADFVEKDRFQLGKCLMPINNAKCMDKNHRYGKKTERPLSNMAELLRPEVDPKPLRNDYLAWVKHLNEMRIHFKKHNISIKELTDYCLHYDKEHTGWISFETFYQVLNGNGITFSHANILPLAGLMGFYRENKVLYKDFIKLFDIQTELPEFGKYDDGYDYSQNYLTTFRAADLDYLKLDNSDCRTAGILSKDFTKRPFKTQTSCRAHIDHLGIETTSGVLVNPSVYTNYGLTHIDFFQPRPPEVLHKIFQNIGYEFPEDTFEKLYEIGLKLDKTGMVCVETFKRLLEVATPVERKDQPQAMCKDTAIKKPCE